MDQAGLSPSQALALLDPLKPEIRLHLIFSPSLDQVIESPAQSSLAQIRSASYIF